jgi:hypothetical protein
VLEVGERAVRRLGGGDGLGQGRGEAARSERTAADPPGPEDVATARLQVHERHSGDRPVGPQ